MSPASRREKTENHKSFIFKVNYLVFGFALGLFIFYSYVIQGGGTLPPSGSFLYFLEKSYLFFAPILVPVIIAFLTSYLHQRTRQNDRR